MLQNGEPLQLKIHHPTFQTCSTFTEIHANHLQQTFWIFVAPH
jgi:hypothetical protein